MADQKELDAHYTTMESKASDELDRYSGFLAG